MKKIITIVLVLFAVNSMAQTEIQDTLTQQEIQMYKPALEKYITERNVPIFKDVTYNIDPVTVKLHIDGEKREVKITTVTISEDINKSKLTYSEELLKEWIKLSKAQNGKEK